MKHNIKKIKNYEKVVLMFIGLLTISSCYNNDRVEDVVDDQNYQQVKKENVATEESNYLRESEQKLLFNVKFLDYQILENLAMEVSRIQDSNLSDSEKEIQIKTVLEPMTLNGREIQQEILNQVDLNDPNFNLTKDDINQIVNMDDKELAQLSFLYSVSYARVHWDTSTVVSCMGAALGITQIYGLIQNTAQLATAQGTIKILKILAKRYIGWIGVGLAVYSFGDCMGAW